jgi:hypothetical protein
MPEEASNSRQRSLFEPHGLGSSISSYLLTDIVTNTNMAAVMTPVEYHFTNDNGIV